MRKDYKKLMVIGSGPIVIGQAAEFDFSGTQACRSLREEGYKTVLVNSNPATIQTDADTADSVYIEPLLAENVAKIIEKEGVEGVKIMLVNYPNMPTGQVPTEDLFKKIIDHME